MLKVNEEKILADYESLAERELAGLEAVAKDARAYAVAHGYSEEQTAKFIAYTQELQGSGLNKEERAKLEVLDFYIEEIEEPAKESAESESVAAATATVENI